MISLAAPIPPVTRSRLDLPTVAFFGRSFNEYLQIFALDPPALRRRPVLDVAGGPSSFTAEACRLGVDAVAVDPLYGLQPEALTQHVRLDYQRMHQRMRERPESFRVGDSPALTRGRRARRSPLPRYASFEAAERDRRGAAQRFLDDYAAHVAHGRYFGAALPHLPFLDGTFDVVLCGHFLFLHQQQFDFAFHLAACRELARVAREEVRVHPLCGPDGERYGQFDQLADELTRGGLTVEIVSLPNEFFVGAHETLILRHAGR